LEAAKRELFEETGATAFGIQPLCDYWVCGNLNNKIIEEYGQVYFAIVHELDEIPESEMEQICLCDELPDELTYPEYTLTIFPLAQKMINFNK
jgi:8-oxo-dGTP diphosphatase